MAKNSGSRLGGLPRSRRRALKWKFIFIMVGALWAATLSTGSVEFLVSKTSFAGPVGTTAREHVQGNRFVVFSKSDLEMVFCRYLF